MNQNKLSRFKNGAFSIQSQICLVQKDQTTVKKMKIKTFQKENSKKNNQ